MAGDEKLILIVDDDEGVRDMIGFVLKKAGYRVETAADGQDALRRVETLRPDLLVLDLMLPRCGGFELLRQLQGSDLARMPIVVVTGRYTDSSTADLIRREPNVVELLDKPIDTTVLLRAIQRRLPGRPGPSGGG